MTRQTWTAFTSAAAFIVLAVLISVLPVPFVTWSPGQTEDVLGAMKGKPVITIAGAQSYPTDGQLDLTVVSGTSADSRLSLPEALLAFWLPGRDTLPRDVIYPPGKTPDEVEAEETQMMATAQDTAVVAALRAARLPVAQWPRVASVTINGPAYNRLRPGDLITAVDDVPATSNETITRQVRTHDDGEKVRFTVLRDRTELTVQVEPVQARVGISLDTGFSYEPTISYDLGQELGGPSAGMIFALAIYDKLTPGALLGGKHLAGTGTITADGAVGPIGGIQQKIAGAQQAEATAFLVPAANCGDLEGVRTELSLIKVDTLQSAIDAVGTLVSAGPDAPGLPRC